MSESECHLFDFLPSLKTARCFVKPFVKKIGPKYTGLTVSNCNR